MHLSKAYDYLSLDSASALPLYRQLYQRVREVIERGMLKAGDRMPATRLLAGEAGLARGTVSAAYDLLAAEGFLEVRGTAGYVVAHNKVAATERRTQPARRQQQKRSKPLPIDVGGAGTPLPFQLGLPALDAFPRKLWARLSAGVARTTQSDNMVRELAFGAPALRAAIASHLKLSRSVNCTPEQVFIVSGYRDALDLIQRTLLTSGQRVWVEEPVYPPTAQVLRGCGMQTVSVPVDQDGIDVARGMALAPDAAAAVVTPAHQSPLTVTLSAARRRALLDWAASAGSWIIEDDYDGEFRLAGRPLPALASMDSAGRVLYFGSFSKVIFPSLRLSYVVVPPTLVERFEDSVALLGRGVPGFVQAIVCDFMLEGHLMRHIQRMRKLYNERRSMVTATLNQALAGHADIVPQAGGLHLLARTPLGADRALAAKLQSHGLAAMALSDWFLGEPTQSGLLFSYTNVSSPELAQTLSRKVAEALDH